jgi:hypothetical protein
MSAEKSQVMAKAQWKIFGKADEVRMFNHGSVELLHMDGGTIGKLTLQPGWRWSTDVKPIAGTQWCEAPHFQYQVSGKLHVVMQDGSEFDLEAGSVSHLPSGHDAWVVGNQPVVLVDWYGASNYAKR